MGIKDLFSKLLRKKRQADLNQSINQSEINQSITEPVEEPSIEDSEKPPESIGIEKDSLQLGIAAGYTGKSIKEIESSLSRIETQMPTRDWFLTQFEDRTPELIALFEKHEKNAQKRFEIVQNLLTSLSKTAKKAPEPVRTELFEQIRGIESQLPITPKMQRLVSVVSESKEISYSDLAAKLGITESALRGLLSLTTKRTDKIERFNRLGRGWVRYKAD